MAKQKPLKQEDSEVDDEQDTTDNQETESSDNECDVNEMTSKIKTDFLVRSDIPRMFH